MLKALLPRDARFYDLFAQDAANVKVAAQAMKDLLDDFTDVEAKVQHIKDLEHIGDNITHRIIAQLHLTFVTPIDREDIAALAHSIDDILDFIEGAAMAIDLYKITKPTEAARAFAGLIHECAAELEKAVGLLRHRNRLKDILPITVEINRLENDADIVLRTAVAELFANQTSVYDLIKWREIYELMENATDRAEDAANVLEGVVLKYA